MVRKKVAAVQPERPRGRASSKGSLARTRRGSKIGLVLIIWAALLGWIGISSYNVIKQQYLSVYAQEQSTDEPRGIQDERTAAPASHEQVVTGPRANTSVEVLLSSGLVVFSVATGIRLLMSRRTEKNT